METDPKAKNKGGRPEGSMNKLAREARAKAQATGKLPHEILLDIARGHPVELLVLDESTGQPKVDGDGTYLTRLVLPTLDDIKDAAKASAPYFAPKISTVEVIQGVSDDELDRIIALAASEAGVSVGFGGEEPETEAEEGAAGSQPAPDEEVRPRRRRTRVDPSKL